MARKRVHPASVAPTALVLLAFCQISPAQGPSDWRDRFLAEAPSAWEAYRALARNLQGSERIIHSANGKVTDDGRSEIRKNARCSSNLGQTLLLAGKSAPAGTLRVINPSYKFTLGRRSVDAPWSIRDVTLTPNSEQPANLEKARVGLPDWCHLTLAYHESLPDMVGQSSFRVLQANAVVLDGVQLVKVEFDNVHPVDDKTPTQSGTVLLDPARYWCVRSVSLNNQHTYAEMTVTGDLEISADFSAPYPVPKRNVFTTVTRMKAEFLSRNKLDPKLAEPQTEQLIEEFDLSEPSSPPADDAFTLSAYGFPEPFGVKTRPRWYLWAGLGGVIFLLLGVLLRWLKQRKVTATSPG